jgi:hypothetical protein
LYKEIVNDFLKNKLEKGIYHALHEVTNSGLKTMIRNKGVFHGKGIVLLCLRFEETRCFQN